MLELDLDWVGREFPAFDDPRLRDWVHLENVGGSYAARQVRDLLTEFYRAAPVSRP